MRYDHPTMARPAAKKINLRLAHSPDPDDAFMWWPLFSLENKPPMLDTGKYHFEQIVNDIESLNALSENGTYEITAMSCAQYARVADTYILTACGASIGDGYGPKIVSRKPMTIDELRASNPNIAIPGKRTTAFAAMSILMNGSPFDSEPMDFKSIIDVVAEQGSRFDAGLIIHEGQLTYKEDGLHEVVDLGRWWRDTYDQPLPLGVNTARKDLEHIHGLGTLQEITNLLSQSVRYAMDHPRDSLKYAMTFGRGLSEQQAKDFCAMYVNRWTLDFGDAGRQAVHRFLEEGRRAGVLPVGAALSVLADASGIC